MKTNRNQTKLAPVSSQEMAAVDGGGFLDGCVVKGPLGPVGLPGGPTASFSGMANANVLQNLGALQLSSLINYQNQLARYNTVDISNGF